MAAKKASNAAIAGAVAGVTSLVVIAGVGTALAIPRSRKWIAGVLNGSGGA